MSTMTPEYAAAINREIEALTRMAEQRMELVQFEMELGLQMARDRYGFLRENEPNRPPAGP